MPKKKGAPLGNRNAAGDGVSRKFAVLHGALGSQMLHAGFNASHNKTVLHKEHAVGGVLGQGAYGALVGYSLVKNAGGDVADEASKLLAISGGMAALGGATSYASSHIGKAIGKRIRPKK
jgi:hypothetical protein